MNVRELREVLVGLDDDTLVVMSKDGEGNRYSPLDGYTPGELYRAESTYSGELVNNEGTAVDDEDWDDGSDAVPCVVLWPVN
jgi:hypothetical protein